MNHAPTSSRPPARRNPSVAGAVRKRMLPLAIACAAALPTASRAIDFGPFSLTGFAKAEAGRVSDGCKNCQSDPTASKHYLWADDLVQGKSFGSESTHVTLFQPYLAAKFDLPRGFKLSGLLSQRWRDGDEDFKGYWYDKSVSLAHEDYGTVQLGAMTTRAWAMADYPFGSDIGLADPWGSSGAGYGLLTRALRYTSRVFDVLDGDLVVELTRDFGKSGWKKTKPRFWELWVHYGHGDLVVDMMLQDARNGVPNAFSHGPFAGPYYERPDLFDGRIGDSGQSIAMVMASYQVDPRLKLYGGLRGNRWSGAYAVFLLGKSQNPLGNYDVWSIPFNVDWSTDLGGGVFKGYPATSIDLALGASYKMGKWTASTGMAHLGAASTANPSDRGQSNAATINTVGLNYDVGRGLQVYGSLGMVNYARRGLSPMSMPGNAAFTNVDSRLKTRGNWFTLGAVYTF